jgi:transcriptional regulator with XRE-family HTH domain
MNRKLIGQKVRALRVKLGITGTRLARKVRLTQAQVSRLETGQQGFRSEVLMRFARVLGVAPAYFFVEGEDASAAKVAQELVGLGLAPSQRLIKALKDKGFLRFMERCAKVMRAHRKNLVRMQKALAR